MVDKDTILQVICGLMKNPTYLSETDKYYLTIDDFTTPLEKYVFSAIYNLYKGGAQKITVVDIDNYFNTHKVAKAVFEKENGIEYLQDALDFSQEENFPFYYRRLKKFRCLDDLNRMGFDTHSIYETDLTNPKAKEINDKFEDLDVSDIFNLLKKNIMKLESEYSTGDASETTYATKNVSELVESLRKSPEVGLSLQGDIFNTICRGARPSKYYIRSAGSGTGKTRAAVGDACALSYPIRFNTECWEWEWNGASSKTLFIATEQELEEVQTLILAYLTGFNEEKILYGQYNDEEWKIVQQAIKVMEIYKDNLFVVRLSNPNIAQLKAVVRQNWIVNNIENVFYDYIFSSPSLLNEFRDLRIREDVVLSMMSTALKDLAVEMNLFVMSSTQTNAKSDDNNDLKNESVIRGSRAIIDKCDIACVVSRVNSEELELLKDIIEEIGIAPNQVTDVFKVRRGRYTNVKIWSYMDLGTCRKRDLFITGEKCTQKIEGFQTIKFMFNEENSSGVKELLESLNKGEIDVVSRDVEKNHDNVMMKEEAKAANVSPFGGLL